jgi:DNA-directed RNA polymerase specialized sigma24 family protein
MALAHTVLKKFKKIPDGDHAAIAIRVADVVHRAVEEDRVTRGSENGLTRQCAHNAACDYLRKRKRETLVDVPPEAPVDGSVGDDDAVEGIDAKRCAQLVRKLLAEGSPLAPQHRDVLRRVYIDETAIEDLAREELDRRQVAGGVEDAVAELELARNLIDARLSRARRALRLILVEGFARELGRDKA